MQPRATYFFLTFLFLATIISPACFGMSMTAPAVSQASYTALELLQQGDRTFIVRYKDDIWTCPGVLKAQAGHPVLLNTQRLSVSQGCKTSLAFEVVIFQSLEDASGELLVFKITREQKPWRCHDTNNRTAKEALQGYKAGEVMRMPVKMLNAKCNEATT